MSYQWASTIEGQSSVMKAWAQGADVVYRKKGTAVIFTVVHGHQFNFEENEYAHANIKVLRGSVEKLPEHAAIIDLDEQGRPQGISGLSGDREMEDPRRVPDPGVFDWLSDDLAITELKQQWRRAEVRAVFSPRNGGGGIRSVAGAHKWDAEKYLYAVDRRRPLGLPELRGLVGGPIKTTYGVLCCVMGVAGQDSPLVHVYDCAAIPKQITPERLMDEYRRVDGSLLCTLLEE